jgi:hypothetical protein
VFAKKVLEEKPSLHLQSDLSSCSSFKACSWCCCCCKFAKTP